MAKNQKKYRHLDFHARDRIEALLDEGHYQVEIAKILGVHKSTISREIRKHRETGVYKAGVADHKAGISRSNSKYQGMKIEAHKEMKQHLIEEMEVKQSPDGISGRMKADKCEVTVSTTAIYRWLYSPFGQQYCKLLCTKRYRRRPQRHTPKREMIKNIKEIHDIPKMVLRNGDVSEADTFLSPKRAKTTEAVALRVKRRSKFISGSKIPSMETKHMTKSMKRLQKENPSDALLMDRGIENRGHGEYGIPTYFCDSHAPWQKPLVEGSIGLARRWFWPKGTDLSKVTEEKLQEGFRILNSKYRKSLGYRSAREEEERYGMIASLLATGVAIH